MYDIAYLKSLGFEGFYQIKNLKRSCSQIPKARGVYAVCRHINYKPKYSPKSCGGWYDGDPTVDVTKLKSKWIENTDVLLLEKLVGQAKILLLIHVLKHICSLAQAGLYLTLEEDIFGN